MSIIKTPITIALTIVLLLGIGYVAWDFWNREKEPIRPLNPYEYVIVQNACSHFTDQLVGVEGLYDLVILPIREKRKRNIPEMMADYLSYTTGINVRSMDQIYSLLREKRQELKKEERATFDEEKYLKEIYLKKPGFGVMKLIVEDFKSGKRGKGAGLYLKAQLQLVNEDGKVQEVKLKPFQQYIKTKFSLLYFSAWMNSIGWGWRILFWLLFTVLLPLSTTSLVIRIASYQSNKYNFLMILGYTAADMLMAFVLTGFNISGTITGILLFLGFLASGIYNYEICDLIDDWS